MLLRARHVLPVSSPPIADGGVVVRASRIHAVGGYSRLAAAHPGERVRDLGDAILFPGLVNAHAHLELTLLRGFLDDLAFFPWLRRLVSAKTDGLRGDEFLYYGLMGAAEMIRAGITTVADCSDSGAAMDALAVTGLRGVVFQEVFAPTAAQAPAAVATLARKLDGMQAMASERVRVGVSPHSTYMACAELLEATLALAIERGLPLSVHAAESPAEDAFVRDGAGVIADHFAQRGWPVIARGMSPLAWLGERGWLDAATPVQLVHLARATPGDLDRVAAAASGRGAGQALGVAACPRSNARLGNGLPDLASLSALGVPWGLGTDGAPAVGRCDLFAEMAFAQTAERGRLADAAALPAKELLRRCTLESARSLGMDAEIGSIEPGKQADLAAIALGPARISPCYDPAAIVTQLATPPDVILTMVAGEILFEHGELKTIDEPRVLARCHDRASLIHRLSRA